MHIKIKFLLLLGIHSTTAFSQVKSSAYDLMLRRLLSHSVEVISVEKAYPLVDSVTFLDTRSGEEYKVSHIKNSIWVGYEDFELEKIKRLDKDAPVILYCSVGYRSEKIGEKLKEAGFTAIYNLYGGVFEWVNQGMHVYNEKGITDEVHPYDRFWGIWLNEGKKVDE